MISRFVENYLHARSQSVGMVQLIKQELRQPKGISSDAPKCQVL